MKTHLKFVLVFAVAFSLAGLSGPMASFHLPTIPLASAVLGTQPCQVIGESGGCSEFWYPAGPEMATEQVSIFTNEVTEYTNLQFSPPNIDFTDWPTPGSVNPSTFTSSPFYLTATVPENSYYEVQFMMRTLSGTATFSSATLPAGFRFVKESRTCSTGPISSLTTRTSPPARAGQLIFNTFNHGWLSAGARLLQLGQPVHGVQQPCRFTLLSEHCRRCSWRSCIQERHGYWKRV